MRTPIKRRYWLGALVLTASALAAAHAPAREQYRVVVLPQDAGGGQMTPWANSNGLMGSVLIDRGKTRILNRLAKEGWRIVAVVGRADGDQTLYLRRDAEPPDVSHNGR